MPPVRCRRRGARPHPQPTGSGPHCGGGNGRADRPRREKRVGGLRVRARACTAVRGHAIRRASPAGRSRSPTARWHASTRHCAPIRPSGSSRPPRACRSREGSSWLSRSSAAATHSSSRPAFHAISHRAHSSPSRSFERQRLACSTALCTSWSARAKLPRSPSATASSTATGWRCPPMAGSSTNWRSSSTTSGDANSVRERLAARMPRAARSHEWLFCCAANSMRSLHAANPPSMSPSKKRASADSRPASNAVPYSPIALGPSEHRRQVSSPSVVADHHVDGGEDHTGLRHRDRRARRRSLTAAHASAIAPGMS